MMSISFQPKYFFGGLAASAALAGAVTYFSGLSFWLIWPLLIVALVINGLLAEWEDNQPGGFNNP
jgi:hypothetical protein